VEAEPNKGDAIVKFQSLIRYALAAFSAFLLGSCGGGGAEQRPIDTGVFSVNPPTATFYAGVMATLTIAGGTPPFQMTSSEPGLLSVPLSTRARTIDVVPNQPGVVDAGLPPEALQVRTVNIVARDAAGNTATAIIQVAQNFLTGYGVFVGNTTCAAGVICLGGETTLFFDSTFNGNLQAGHQFRLERVRGPFQFIDPLNSNNQVDSVIVTADHEGKFTAVIRVATGLPAQVILIKVTDLATGAYTFRTLTVSTAPATGNLTAIPSTITLTGPDPTICGNGNVDVLVFDGRPPYTATCPNPAVFVENPTSGSNPGRFTFSISTPSTGGCLTAVPCVITDSTGARTTVTITTEVGPAPPAPTPPPALDVAPAAVDLTCGSTSAVTVVGGTGSYQVNSTHPRVVATVSGNTISITRLTGDTAAGGFPFATTGTVTVTDGSSIATVDLTTVPGFCGP